MNNPQFFLFLALCFTGIIALEDAYAEPGEPSKTPLYVDHVRAWYDERQQLYSIYGPAEPVYYSGFYLEPLGTVQCNNWIVVNGIVPNNGILYFTIISGDYIGFHNVSHTGTSALINYFWLPCTGDNEASLLATFMYFGDDSPYPVKANDEYLLW